MWTEPSLVRKSARASVTAGAIALGSAVLYRVDLPWLRRLTVEDGPVENLTSIAYIVAAGLMAWGAWQSRQRGLFLWMHAVLFFFVAGEEISWGQRILGFGTPAALDQINVQHEFTLHNIEGARTRLLGLLVIGAMCLGLPLLCRISGGVRKLCEHWNVPVFPSFALGVVIVAYLLQIVPRFWRAYGAHPLDEVAEMLHGISFVYFGWDVVVRRGLLPSSNEAATSATRLPERLTATP